MLVGFIYGLCVLPLVAKRVVANRGMLALEANRSTLAFEDEEGGSAGTTTPTAEAAAAAGVDPAQAAVQALTEKTMDRPLTAFASLGGSQTAPIWEVGHYAVKVFLEGNLDDEMAAWKKLEESDIHLGSEPIAEAQVVDGKVVPAQSSGDYGGAAEELERRGSSVRLPLAVLIHRDVYPALIYRLGHENLDKALWNRQCPGPVTQPACAKDVMEWAKTRSTAWIYVDYIAPACQAYVVQALSVYKNLEEDKGLIDHDAMPRNFVVFQSQEVDDAVDVLLADPKYIKPPSAELGQTDSTRWTAPTPGLPDLPQHNLERFLILAYNSFLRRTATSAVESVSGLDDQKNTEYRTAQC